MTPLHFTHGNHTMKIIVAGSRKFHDYPHMTERLDHLFSQLPSPPTIISGTAGGADRLGERYATEKGLELIRMPADWDRFGKSAGYKRNQAMADIADGCVCFWDGNQHRSGTFHMINIARQKGLELRIVRFRSIASPADLTA